MKLTLFLFSVVGLLTVNATAYSQLTKLNLNLKNASAKEALSAIEKQTDYSFMYDDRKVDVNYRKTINLKDVEIDEALNSIFKGKNIKYNIVDNHIILSKGGVLQDNKRFVTIKGKVTDENGNTLPGVSIIVKNTTIGRTTDQDGLFELNVPAESKTLICSFIGMKREEISIEGKQFLNIVLKEEAVSLQEVVAIGYGTMEKRELTSSVTSVKSKDLIAGVSSSPLGAIQGKVTGLSIVNKNGADPNTGISIQLRGANSIKASQGPLVVVDGVPGGDINTIAREDIESIDVLKDASAAAIYGTRASGGVILVTTKKAKAGPAVVTYSGELSTEVVRRKAEVLSAEEYLQYERGDDYGHRTDWFDEVTRDNPFTQRHVITASGGSKNARVYASLYHKDAKGLAIGADREETGARINFDLFALDNRLTISGHTNFTNIKASFSDNNIFKMALKLNPTESPYDETHPTGLNVMTGGWEYYNPVAHINLRKNQSEWDKLQGDVTLKYKLTNDLEASFTGAIKKSTEHPYYWQSRYHKGSIDSSIRGSATQKYKTSNSKSVDFLLRYQKEIGAHRIKAFVGHSYQKFNGEGFEATNKDFPVDGVEGHDLGSGTYLSEGRAKLSSYKNPTQKLSAFLGRVNYSWNDKYLFSGSLRYEGSSKFLKDNRWGLFPAVSAGWRISEESFMRDISWIDDLKIRGGYGKTGNEGFKAGTGTRMYKADQWWLVNGTWIKTYGLDHNTNPDLQWETKTEINFGVDFEILDGKLSGKFDVYKRTSDNLIYEISVSQPPAIHDKTVMNVGSLENKGFEAELTWNAVQTKDFTYSTTLLASHNVNTLKSLWGSQTFWNRKGFPAPGNPGHSVRLAPGERIGRFHIWKHAGFTEEGNWKLYDKEGNAFDVTQQQKTQDDRQFVGNGIPKLRLSWQNSFSYKNLDLSLYFRSWLFYDVFNMIDMYYGLHNVQEQNVLKSAYGRNAHITGDKELCDYWLEDGSFLKLSALTLGYTFPKNTFGKKISNARIYFTAKDLFTLTGYSGLDPEVNINGLEPGFEEINVYPKTSSFTLGVQVQF